MKSEMLSVVVGTEECIASCPFCVSCEKVGSCVEPNVNMRNFRIALDYAKKAGVSTIEFTGRGEPLLYPEQLTNYLSVLAVEYASDFPFKELQTNAILIGNNTVSIDTLKMWYDYGLTHIAISTVSIDNKMNALNYLGNENANYPDLSATIKVLHKIGFTVRLVCIMAYEQGYVHSYNQMEEYISFSKVNSVEQLTFRPLNEEFRREDAHNWCKTRLLTDSTKNYISRLLEDYGSVIQDIPRVGRVYDINGQNVMFAVPMNAKIANSDSESTRQLIYFPDGRLRYEWEKFGAVLL